VSGKLNDELVYEHISHLEYALLWRMAGMEQSIGLDVESFCRVQDNKEENKATDVPYERTLSASYPPLEYIYHFLMSVISSTLFSED
jgi:hypothetical protein